MKKLHTEKTAKAIEQGAEMPSPDLRQALEEAKARTKADDGTLTKAQLNQLKKSARKANGGTIRSSLF